MHFGKFVGAILKRNSCRYPRSAVSASCPVCYFSKASMVSVEFKWEITKINAITYLGVVCWYGCSQLVLVRLVKCRIR
jgi:hypothetical protein